MRQYKVPRNVRVKSLGRKTKAGRFLAELPCQVSATQPLAVWCIAQGLAYASGYVGPQAKIMTVRLTLAGRKKLGLI